MKYLNFTLEDIKKLAKDLMVEFKKIFALTNHTHKPLGIFVGICKEKQSANYIVDCEGFDLFNRAAVFVNMNGIDSKIPNSGDVYFKINGTAAKMIYKIGETGAESATRSDLGNGCLVIYDEPTDVYLLAAVIKRE